MSQNHAELVESSAVNSAQAYSRALQEFRSAYASEVVSVARAEGIEAAHDYENRPGVIPLPATMTILLGQRIGELDHGAQSQLYSPHPFPWRKAAGGLQDEFAEAAWAAVSADPGRPFYRVHHADGQVTLRFATADRMRTGCVQCHNSHPDTPKDDWQIGDVRGGLEVAVPLDNAVAMAAQRTRKVVMTVAGVAVPGLLVLWVALS